MPAVTAPETTAPPETDARLDRIRALTNYQKHMMLVYLDGSAPEAVEAAFASAIRLGTIAP